jgi:hypothetical protein
MRNWPRNLWLLLGLLACTSSFGQPKGPDAPTLDWIELDRELIVVLTNDTTGRSNNPHEDFTLGVVNLPDGGVNHYHFEGYRLFQLAGPEVTLADRDDPAKVREVCQVDRKNWVTAIFNWDTFSADGSPMPPGLYAFHLQVDGQNEGIRHTFRITEDLFAHGDRRLVNHKRYYFAAVAYAHNEYAPFDPFTGEGQSTAYLEGQGNIGDGNHPYYVVIPHPVVDREVKARYGGVEVTRLAGIGNGGNFLDLNQESRDQIEAAVRAGQPFAGPLTYQGGKSPVEVRIYNPLAVKDGEYEITLVDTTMENDTLEESASWVLRKLSDPGAPVVVSDRPINSPNEQLIAAWGISVRIGQVPEVGAKADPTNGVVGYEEEYAGGPAAEPWIRGLPDGFRPGESWLAPYVFDYVANGPGEVDEHYDPTQAFSHIGPGTFVPYFLCDWRNKNSGQPYITPAWTDRNNGNNTVRQQSSLRALNNVDIVLTADKSLWSRCVIVESANRFYEENGFFAEGERVMFDLRDQPSVSKFDNDNDGRPDVETNPLPHEEEGMGWFPGYAMDVETGERLNIFFGENSVYNGSFLPELHNGGDMMFNPSSDIYVPVGGGQDFIFNYVAGGQHFIYVTNEPYDRCELLADRFEPSPSALRKVAGLKKITWAGFVVIPPTVHMRPYADGLIPEDVRIKLRVNNPYQVRAGTGDYNGYPTYRFRIEGQQATPLTPEGVADALDQIRIAPNPCSGAAGVARVINLPARCVVTLYTLDGRIVRQYQRDEQPEPPHGYGIPAGQVTPDLELALSSANGARLVSGVYLLHVRADGLGERTLQWVVIN